jgi:hypothetical protein
LPRAPGHLPLLGLWLLAAGLIIRLVIQVLGAAREPSHGFVGHYAASRLLLERAPAAAFYDDSLFIAEVQRHDPGVIDIFGANPPTVAFTATPLAVFPYAEVRMVWTVASLMLWLLAVYWLARTVGLGGLWTPALLCVAALFQPAVENLRHGQFHVLVLVLFLVAWHGQRRRRPAATGASLGVAVASKAAGVALWPFLLATRQWRALTWAAFTFLGIAAASIPLLGIEAWPAFIERAGQWAAAGPVTVTAYQSVPGLVRRLTVEDARLNPSPLLDLGTAGITLSWIAVAGLLAYSLLVAPRHPPPRVFAAFVALGLAISPVSIDYHYVVAILPLVVLLSLHRDALFSSAGLLTVCALAIIGLDLPYRSARLADGWITVFAYPKLYGALILWWLLLRPAPARRGGFDTIGVDG